ncbi:MAG: helix-turn-helix domain-containing protein [Bacteroidetes bacterium]|nr:helix-turn-helix domain-containing protein [Bacteroidota bacterium]
MLETKKIGNKIAEARKRANISQAQLAECLFISPQAVGKWERGESMPDIITFNRLADILGVDLNYFSDNMEPSIAPLEPSVKQQVDAPSSNQKEKMNWDMSDGNWVEADFSGLKNLNGKFSSSNMQGCKFIGSDLSGLLLKNNNVDGCDFSGSNIGNSQIRSSYLNKNLFKDCSLMGSEFKGSHFNLCDCTGADFTGTRLSETFIYGCDLTGCNFTGMELKSGGFTGVADKTGAVEKNIITNALWNRTSFIDTHIADVVFTGILEDCYFENCAFTRVTFRNATLVNTFFKNNRKLKRIVFINCNTDRMTYEFLKQGKADLTGITLLTGENE